MSDSNFTPEQLKEIAVAQASGRGSDQLLTEILSELKKLNDQITDMDQRVGEICSYMEEIDNKLTKA